MLDLIKIAPCQKVKILPVYQTRNRGRIYTQIYGKELKYRPYPYMLKKGCSHMGTKLHKKELYTHGGKSAGPHYHTPTKGGRGGGYSTLIMV